MKSAQGISKTINFIKHQDEAWLKLPQTFVLTGCDLKKPSREYIVRAVKGD